MGGSNVRQLLCHTFNSRYISLGRSAIKSYRCYILVQFYAFMLSHICAATDYNVNAGADLEFSRGKGGQKFRKEGGRRFWNF